MELKKVNYFKKKSQHLFAGIFYFTGIKISISHLLLVGMNLSS